MPSSSIWLTLLALFFAQVIMATNRIDILDPALLRPGRIDRKIEFPAPNEESREQILRIHSRKMNLTRGIDLKMVREREQASKPPTTWLLDGTPQCAMRPQLLNRMRTSPPPLPIPLATQIAGMLGTANGAECKAVCTEAGMFALRERRMHVTMEDFVMSCAKVMKKDAEKDMSVMKLFK